MYIDCKETIWNRLNISDEYGETVKEMLDKGQTYSDIQEYLDERHQFKGVEYLFETAEELEPADNYYQNTMELLDENGNCIWGNYQPKEENLKDIDVVNDIFQKAEKKAYNALTPSEYKVFGSFIDYAVENDVYKDFLEWFAECSAEDKQ